MAFRASTISLQQGFTQLLSLAMQEKAYLNSWSQRLNSNITSLDGLEWTANLTRILANFDAISILPGLQAYAQAQFDDPLYNVGAEYTALRSALDAVREWLVTNIPSNSVSITNGVLVGTTYAPAATAPLKALIDAASAQIA